LDWSRGNACKTRSEIGLPASPEREKAVYVESYGCSANRFDLEIMLAKLIGAGYKAIHNTELADIILINTCAVKKPTEDRILQRLRVLSLLNKPLIVSGCLPKIDLKAIRKSASSFSAALDPHSVDRILEAVIAAQNGERNRLFFSEKPGAKLLQPKIRLNKLVEIVQISEGCAGACSFCCVRFARGRLFSYPKELIVRRINEAVLEGAREIWVTSQDSGAYGLDIGTNLVELLEDCCEIEGDFLIRVGMMNPNHVSAISKRLARVYKESRIFKFLHLPVQSGDDEVLEWMNRSYSVKDFERIVSTFRKEMPEITLSTDIICGFPGETEAAFEKTIELVRKVKPDIVNVSRFFPRPHTPAENMKQFSVEEVKSRSRHLSGIARQISLERNKSWLDWKGRILVDEKGKDETWVGRNFAYKPIVVKSWEYLIGRFVSVRVIGAFPTYLKAQILK